jgi:hypothetical protein
VHPHNTAAGITLLLALAFHCCWHLHFTAAGTCISLLLAPALQT